MIPIFADVSQIIIISAVAVSISISVNTVFAVAAISDIDRLAVIDDFYQFNDSFLK